MTAADSDLIFNKTLQVINKQSNSNSRTLSLDGFIIALDFLAQKYYKELMRDREGHNEPLARLIDSFLRPLYNIKMTDVGFTNTAGRIKDEVKSLQHNFLNKGVVSDAIQCPLYAVISSA